MKLKYTPTVGNIFGKWTITSILPIRKKGRIIVVAKCKCGYEKENPYYLIASGKSKSCGCVNPMQSHGLCHHPLYAVWNGIVSRCYNKNHRLFNSYGGRGIKMYKPWRNKFLLFYNWCINNGWKSGLQIDRENNNRGYYPSNCRFTTSKVNNRNRRNNRFLIYKNERRTIAEWSEIKKIPADTLTNRLNTKWPIEKIFDPCGSGRQIRNK